MESVGGGYVILDFEDNHAPPLWVRNKTEQNKLDKRRKTACKHGDHSHCEPRNCEALKESSSSSASKSSERSAFRFGSASRVPSKGGSAFLGAESSSETQVRSEQLSTGKAFKEEASESEKTVAENVLPVDDPWPSSAPAGFDDDGWLAGRPMPVGPQGHAAAQASTPMFTSVSLQAGDRCTTCDQGRLTEANASRGITRCNACLAEPASAQTTAQKDRP
ncbi:hypothetical protein [Arthrobacter gyeryongensis]|uniref:hypothetical protein n=1 Tax=Arthrobacter gyeryongensis TaxID=1650592 RepID=UPI0031E7CEDD